MTEERNPFGNERIEAGKLSPESSTSRTLLACDAQDANPVKRCSVLFKNLKLEPLKFDNKRSESSHAEPNMPQNRRGHYRGPKTKTPPCNEMQLMHTSSKRNTSIYYNQMQALALQAMLKILCRALHKDDEDEEGKLFLHLRGELERIHVISPIDGDQCIDAMLGKYSKVFESMLTSYQNVSCDSVNSSQVTVTDLIPKAQHDLAKSFSALINFMPKNWSLESFLNSSRYISNFSEKGLLGQGGYGKVYKVKNKVDGMIYAVKKIKLHCTKEHKLVTVQREVQVMASLKHSNIVTYFSSWWEIGDSSSDSSESSDTAGGSSYSSTSNNGKMWNSKSKNPKKVKGLPVTLYVQMELCHNTLEMYLKERNDTLAFFKDPLDIVDEEFCFDIFQQILIGVQYVHSKFMMHRDLKPSNVFVDKEKREVKIGDFGLARNEWIGSIEELTKGPYTPLIQQKGNFTAKLGTASYAAPEQLNGSTYNNKADMYSLGFIDFELFYPFATKMERAKMMQALRMQEGNITELTRIQERWPLQAKFILKLLCHNPCVRPSASELLEMCPKISEKDQIRELQVQLRKREEIIREMGIVIKSKEKYIRHLQAQKRRLYKHLGHAPMDKKRLSTGEMQEY